MGQSVHTFAGADTDSSAETRAGTAFIAATNIALEPGQADVQRGNVLVPYVLPTGTNKRLGGFTDGSTGTLVSLLYNSNGNHRLVRYDPSSNTGAGGETTILEWSGLNLSRQLVAQGGIVDGLLIYLDASGVIRCVNLVRAAAGEYTPSLLLADPFALHLIKQAPGRKITAQRYFNNNTNDPRRLTNLVGKKSYQFSERWRYVDGEVTDLGTFTLPMAVSYNTQLNFIRVAWSGPQPLPLVEVVELCVREEGDTIWRVVEELRRLPSGLFPAIYDFYGTTLGGALSEVEGTKASTALSPEVGAICIANSRVEAGNCREGFNPTAPALQLSVVTEASTFTAASYQVVLNEQTFYTDTSGATQAYITPRTDYYVLVSGSYPNADSRYRRARLVGPGLVIFALSFTTSAGNAREYASLHEYGYNEIFVDYAPHEVAGSRVITVRPSATITDAGYLDSTNQRTLRDSSGYIAGLQFLDAQQRPMGAVSTKELKTPPAPAGAVVSQTSIKWQLPTMTPTALNLEIPPDARYYVLLLSRNRSTTAFLQGRTADILRYCGELVPNENNQASGALLKDPAIARGEALWLDIGNLTADTRTSITGGTNRILSYEEWIAAGYGVASTADHANYLEYVRVDQVRSVTVTTDSPSKSGYVFTANSGDRLRFLDFPTLDYPILYQRGDYIAIKLDDLTTFPSKQQRFEIYTPTTQVETTLYERSPRFPILRTTVGGVEYRSYEQTQGYLLGDCFYELAQIAVIYHITIPADYTPPVKKQYTAPDAGDSVAIVRSTAKGANSSTWLDASRGRPAFQIPGGLNVVRRRALIRYSDPKIQGTKSNGLSQWDALNQYDELPQEQGAIIRMTVADQTQTDGSILLVNQERGDDSLALGRGQVQTADGQNLLTVTKNVIGSGNALRGGYGCTDAGGVVSYGGKVFYPCRRREEVLRYDRNGLTPLGEIYKFSKRLKTLFRLYASGSLTACYHPSRKEYWLTFEPVGDLPGETVVFSDRPNHEAWAGSVTCVPEAGIAVDNELTVWRGGALWRHTPTAGEATFFGEYTAPEITFEANQPNALDSKTWQAIGINSLSKWVPTLLTTPAGQVSRMLPGWLIYIEGVYRGSIRRDETSPGAGTQAQKLHGGRKLQSATLQVTLTAPDTSPLPLVAATVDFLINTGQQPNQ